MFLCADYPPIIIGVGVAAIIIIHPLSDSPEKYRQNNIAQHHKGLVVLARSKHAPSVLF